MLIFLKLQKILNGTLSPCLPRKVTAGGAAITMESTTNSVDAGQETAFP